MPNPWIVAEQALAEAQREFGFARTVIEGMEWTEHITENMTPVEESIKRFRELAADKVQEQQ